MTDTTLRLACYDGIFRESTQTTAVPRPSAWQLNQAKSKIDDKEIATAFVVASEPFSDKHGRRYRPVLMMRCKDGRTALYLNFDGAFVSDINGFGQVTFRVDKKPAVKRDLQVSTDNMALGLWNGEGVGFVKSALGGQTLLVLFTPYNDSPNQIEFPISGIDDAVKPIRALCKW